MSTRTLIISGGLLLLVALGIAVTNSIVNFFALAVDAMTKNFVTPFIFLPFCIGGIMILVYQIGRMSDGTNSIIQNFSSFSFWALLGSLIYSIPAGHLRFWFLGVVLGTIVIIITKFSRAYIPLIGKFVGFIFVFCALYVALPVVWDDWQTFLSLPIWIYKTFIVTNFSWWHSLTTGSAFICSIWLFGHWFETVYWKIPELP